MAEFKKFNFKSKEEFENKMQELGSHLGMTEDVSILNEPVKIKEFITPNAIAILPMEGCDGMSDGSPSKLTFRRYQRFAEGGAGLLWFEACAVVAEGRANPLKLFIHRENLGKYKELVEMCHTNAMEVNGYCPVTILQLTHSGRYSRPFDHGAPMIPQHDPLLDSRVGITEDYPEVSGAYLDQLQERYVEAALLAKEAGFNGVDIKACHRYLISKLLASHIIGGILETFIKVRCTTHIIIFSKNRREIL